MPTSEANPGQGNGCGGLVLHLCLPEVSEGNYENFDSEGGQRTEPYPRQLCYSSDFETFHVPDLALSLYRRNKSGPTGYRQVLDALERSNVLQNIIILARCKGVSSQRAFFVQGDLTPHMTEKTKKHNRILRLECHDTSVFLSIIIVILGQPFFV